jgi:hypothetical protein
MKRTLDLLASLMALGLLCVPLFVCSNQNGIKSALEGKRAATVKGYFDNAFREVRPGASLFGSEVDGHLC